MNNNVLDYLRAGGAGETLYNETRKINEAIVKKWDGIGFTKGLNGQTKENVAILFENTAKRLLTEATSAQSSGAFETVVFPIVRRVFSRLLANEIVSVQALNMPVGKMFFFYPTTSERQWETVTAGKEMVGRHAGMMGATVPDLNNSGQDKKQYFLPDCVIGTDGCDLPTTYKKSLYDLYYNDFLFDNSKGTAHLYYKTATLIPVTINDSGDFVTGATVASMADANGVIHQLHCVIGGFHSYNAGRLIGPDGNEMDSEAFLASLKIVTSTAIPSSESTEGVTAFEAGAEIPHALMAQRYGRSIVEYESMCNADGRLYLKLDFDHPSAETSKTGWSGVPVSAITGTTITISWCSYDTLELEDEMGEVSFDLRSVTVDVTERKLKAVWSPELATDVQAFQNIDAEAELTALLSEQIASEIDREILRDLRHGNPWNVKWDYLEWRRLQNATLYTQKEWNQMLVTRINQIDAQINKATLRGGANFIVVSAEISAVLNDLSYFNVTDASAESNQYNMGIEKVGSLQGRFTVFRDPYSPAYSCLIGHQGKDLLDTGYIYAPYTPLTLTNTVTAFTNMANVKAIMTRYAKKMVNNRYYGEVRCSNLVTFDVKELH